MQRADEKTTVPNPSAATDGEQPFFKEPDASIADFPLPDNEDFSDDFFRRINDPGFLPTCSMPELYGRIFHSNLFTCGRIPLPQSGTVTANRRSSKIYSIRVHICLPVRRKSASHFSWRSLPFMSAAENHSGILRCSRERFSIWLWRTIRRDCNSGFIGCSARTSRPRSTFQTQQSRWAVDLTSRSRPFAGNTRIQTLSLSTRCKRFGNPETKNAAMPAIMRLSAN